MKKSLLIIFPILLFTSCVTPSYVYDGIDDKLNTEFVENTTEEITSYTIRGNAKKFESDAKDALIIYGAQLAWKYGYKYFIVEDIETRYDISEYTGSYYQAKGTLILFNNLENKYIKENYDKYWDAQGIFNAQDVVEFNADIDRQRHEAETNFWWF